MKVIEGQLKGRGKKVGVVVSRFNEYITKRLLSGCLRTLKAHGVSDKNITVVWVPGAFEIPLVAQKLAKKRAIQGVVCLGAVIRGETFHYDLVAEGVAQGISRVSTDLGKPVIFGVITTDTIEQANKRSKEKGENKGVESAEVVLEMMDVIQQMSKE